VALRERRLAGSAGGLRIAVAPNRVGRLRIAFSIPRSTGGAVIRNRLRRRLRAALQRHHAALQGWDVLVSAAPTAASGDSASLGAALERCLEAVRRRGGDVITRQARENGSALTADRGPRSGRPTHLEAPLPGGGDTGER